MSDLIFNDAVIASVTHKFGECVASQVNISTVFTREAGAALQSAWAFERASRYRSVDLDCEIGPARVTFHVAGLKQHLTLDPVSAIKFRVVPELSKKKRTGRLLVRFALVHAGSPFELLEHVIRFAGTTGSIRITPLQVELPMDAPETETTISINGGPEVAFADFKAAIEVVTSPAYRGIPKDPTVPEWRTEEEIAAGVPHHIIPEEDLAA